MSRLFEASVLENKELIKDHYLLTLHPLEKTRKPEPGNFFMVSVETGLDPLLKRPLSIHRRTREGFQLLYRIAGKGTKILSGKRPDDLLEIIGPLGNGFPVSRGEDDIILVAGGIGIAPLFCLAESLLKKKGGGSRILFYGARTRDEVLCMDELKSIGIETVISTDDGTSGERGDIVRVLKNFLSRSSSSATNHLLYACGPEPMLKSLSALAMEYNLKGYFALEQNMACGLGTCLGCVVNTVHGYKRVCKEGPVFPIEEILWR